MTYCSQLKARTQLSGKYVQEFSSAVEHLVPQALFGLPQYFVQMEAACAFVDGIQDREMKLFLLIDGEKKFDEALNQALRLEAVKATAGSPARLCVGRPAETDGSWPPGIKHYRAE
jgi:hypothetical protein